MAVTQCVRDGYMPMTQGRRVWLLEEDRIILSTVSEIGFRWRTIASYLPGRSDDAVRNRWNRLQVEPP